MHRRRLDVRRESRKVTAAIYLNGATLMTTPTHDVVAIALEAGYSGIEARAERLLRDATEVRATAAVVRPNEVLALNGVALSLRSDRRTDGKLIEAGLKARLSVRREICSPYLPASRPGTTATATWRRLPGSRDAL